MPKPENVEPYQFQPGQSGNPKGKPKGARSMSTILRELLETTIEVDGEKIPYSEAIIKKLIKRADKGNLIAIREIFDRMEGKAKQEVQMNIEGRKSVADAFPELNEGDKSQP